MLFITCDGKPFFVQQRIGKDEATFHIYKFRTMTDRADASGKLLPDAQRLTRFGKKIRKYSLDELPQLINILRGDMSFVGPRPLLPKYLPYYTSYERRRHEVRPGITGLAQVSGRNQTPWERRLALDVEYRDSVSPFTDGRILALTLTSAVLSKGVEIDATAGSLRDLDVERGA